MAATDLPNEFDIIIAGTGLTETIVAAAFSRIGLKVLHIDRNDYYGGSYANFNLQAIDAWKEKNERLAAKSSTLTDSSGIADIQHLLKDGEKVVSLPSEPAQACSIKSNFHIRERTEEEVAAAEATKSHSIFYTPPVKISPQNVEQELGTELDLQTREENIEQVDSENKDIDNQTPEGIYEVSAAKDGQSKQFNGIGSGDDSLLTDKMSKIKLLESKGDGEQVDNVISTTSDSVVASETEADVGDNRTEQHEAEKCKEWTVGDIKDEWRKFCFDLSPKVLYSCGDTVELLIQSDVARYCEFRTVSRVLTLLNNNLQQVPCSRADVFSSKSVSLIEKRLMMKFLQFAADFENNPEEYQEYKGRPFVDFLKSKKLTPNILHYVQHAIAMVTDTATTIEGLQKTQLFLRSLGRYGNTAFLFPLYGTGELPQAFARLSAVFGGVYCLQMSPTHVIADSENKCCGIVASNGQVIRCKYLIAEASYLPSFFVLPLSSKKVSRAIFITDSSILSSTEAELSLLNFDCKDDPTRPVTVLELPNSACVCPKDLFVVQLTRVAAHTYPEEDFTEVKETLFFSETSGDKPKVLWSMYFGQDDKSQMTLSDGVIENVLVVSGGGDAGVSLDFCVDEAKCIFQTVCPDEDFLPKPPNPDDIIHVDDTETAVATGPSEFEAKGGQDEAGKSEEVTKNKDGFVEKEDVAVVGTDNKKINIETGEQVLNSEGNTV